MTIFGPDISSYQNGLDLAQLAAASFVIAKTTEGTYYTDSGYQGWRLQAARLGKPFVWYHFLSGEDAHAQVAHTVANVGDSALPGMLDVEPNGSFFPTMSQVLAYVDAAHADGLNLRLLYLPRWYWQQLGSPSLTPLADRGLRLISSSYPGGTGSPQQLYPGDGAAGWQPYGGVTPLMYQYTNQATDAGRPLDYNAFRGTPAQFAALLGAPMTTPSTGGTMPNIPDSIASQDPDLPEIRQMFPAGAPFDPNTALIWTDERAAAANIHAKQALGAISALQQLTASDDAAIGGHLQQISDAVGALTAVVHELASAPTGVVSQVDPAAYAAALAPPLAVELAKHLTLMVGTR